MNSTRRTRFENSFKLTHYQELIEDDPAYPQQFLFSVLHILPKTMARDEIIERETRYKRKLGSRATGLNSN